jgi:hypothetical protein
MHIGLLAMGLITNTRRSKQDMKSHFSNLVSIKLETLHGQSQLATSERTRNPVSDHSFLDHMILLEWNSLLEFVLLNQKS